MKKILIVGNPNTGKSTLFNSLTYSDEHTGNWHGVTVDKKSKIIKYDNEEYEFYDLPGLYSLSCFSMEEEVSKKYLFENKDALIFYIIDANSIKRNMYLLLQLLDMNFNVKILINNYKYFQKNGGKINCEKIEKTLNCPCEIINAEKIKINKKILKYNKNNNENTIKNSGFIANFNNIKLIYDKIDSILDECVINKSKYIYGENKFDKFLLKPIIFFPLFIVGFFLILYFTFFLIGPKISNLFTVFFDSFWRRPLMFVLDKYVQINWVYSLIDKGIFSAIFTICSFLPQVCLLYVFLSILEDTGIISRLAFMSDDFLNKLGLNGKCVYTMLMGFGCNTTACYTSKNMADKNSKIKTALITPFMSCTAKLPIYVVVCSAIFKTKSVLIIASLYLIGIAVALLLACVYEKTIFKSQKDDFLIEFPPLKSPKIKRVLHVGLKSSKQFFIKIFGIIFSMNIIIWLLTNLTIGFRYTDIYQNSMLYFICKNISILLKPIGLNSPGIVTALIVGLVAKELIVSSMLITNKVSTNAGLISSLSLASSEIFFTKASAISFLIFVLLYFPCVSTFAVLKKEIGAKWTWFGVVSEFLIAYIMSFIAYKIFTGNFWTLVGVFVGLIIIYLAFKYIAKRIKNKNNLCLGCLNCCNKKQ